MLFQSLKMELDHYETGIFFFSLCLNSNFCLSNYCTVMSADDGKHVVMKGVTHGACDYLIKPVRIEALKNIWQHVVRKRKNEWKDLEQSGSVEDGDRQQKPSEDVDYSSSANEGNWKNSKRRKDEEDDAEERDDTSTLKKPRVVWSVELHQQFVAAVNQLGIDSMILSPVSFSFFILIFFLSIFFFVVPFISLIINLVAGAGIRKCEVPVDCGYLLLFHLSLSLWIKSIYWTLEKQQVFL